MTTRSPATIETADLVTRLRAWTATHPHVAAAVELLIQHDYWLDSGHFRRHAVGIPDPDADPDANPDLDSIAVIRWSDARKAFDAGEFNASSTTQRSILDLAIALGEDRYKLQYLDGTNSRLVALAVTKAVRP